MPSDLFDDILLYTVCRYTFSYIFMFGENQSKKSELLKDEKTATKCILSYHEEGQYFKPGAWVTKKFPCYNPCKQTKIFKVGI